LLVRRGIRCHGRDADFRKSLPGIDSKKIPKYERKAAQQIVKVAAEKRLKEDCGGPSLMVAFPTLYSAASLSAVSNFVSF